MAQKLDVSSDKVASHSSRLPDRPCLFQVYPLHRQEKNTTANDLVHPSPDMLALDGLELEFGARSELIVEEEVVLAQHLTSDP